MHYGTSIHIDHFSCEGEARVRTGSSLGELLDSLMTGDSDILKGYNPTSSRGGYVLGVSKLEHLVSDSFPLNSMKEAIGND
jgi:hypothetical protein